MAVGECGYRAEEEFLGLVAVKPGVGFEGLEGVLGGVVDGEVVPGTVLTEVVDAVVMGYAVEPGGEFGVAAECVEVAPGAEEGVLEDVVGVGVGEDYAADVHVEGPAVAADGFFERAAAGQGVGELVTELLVCEVSHILMVVFSWARMVLGNILRASSRSMFSSR